MYVLKAGIIMVSMFIYPNYLSASLGNLVTGWGAEDQGRASVRQELFPSAILSPPLLDRCHCVAQASLELAM